MARDEAYREAEKKIEKARWSGMTELDLNDMKLTELPKSLGKLAQLRSLNLSHNQLTTLPESLGQLAQLQSLDLSHNQLTTLPESLGQLAQLQSLSLQANKLTGLPKWLGKLKSLTIINIARNSISQLPDSIVDLPNLIELYLGVSDGNPLSELPPLFEKLTRLRILDCTNCKFTDLPPSLAQLDHLEKLTLVNNPLNPELAAAYKEGLSALKSYLRAMGGDLVSLNEAKLILIGEGEVGKSCLLGALRGDEWVEGRPTTHGIEIKPVNVTDPDTGIEITLNGWDFGGQRVYRPTHQLFFSAPAVYLVVWKPREGPQQGFVKEWIKLVKHREPDAKILVVATHGGPGQRQPDVDRQEIWDLFGRDTVLDFFLVESKPDEKTGERRGIAGLKDAIAQVAASLPGMGRSVPAHWQRAREALKWESDTYLSLEEVLKICLKLEMDSFEARLFLSISHQLGHLIHYEHDPTLRDIVVLKPDWLATAISFVLDDEQTRNRRGLVDFPRLSHLWNDPARANEFRYKPKLHRVFRRLMERFDLSYKVVLPSDEIGFWRRAGMRLAKVIDPEAEAVEDHYTSLIAQLVPDVRPVQDLIRVWPSDPAIGDEQQVQICRIVDASDGQSATAEGSFYQLIVRLHKFSLGRVNYEESVHWQRGLVVDDDYNGRALLEHIGNDIRITVRAPYPERFLSALTYEVKWLVENFWEGLRCEVVVPCVEPCGKDAPGTGQFEVQKLIAFKRQGMTMFPCIVSGCNQVQDIDCLLRNAPAAQPMSAAELLADLADVKSQLRTVRQILIVQQDETIGRFDKLDSSTQRILSKVDDAFSTLMQTMLDEAKDGPRLFSFQPVDSGFLDLPTWQSQKFLLTLWCEHSRLPLPALNGAKDKRGVYELDLPRVWFVKHARWLKVLTGTLSLVLPVASSAVKLALDDATYKSVEKGLDLGQKTIESAAKGIEKAESPLKRSDARDLGEGDEIEARGAILRQLHALLKEKDPSFGGLVRVRNKRQEFLWVHSQFESEY